MLNTKYYIFNLDGNGVIDLKSQFKNKTPGVLKNPYALGNAWTIKEIKWVSNPDDEFLSLNDTSFDPSSLAIINEKYKQLIPNSLTSGKSKVFMKSYKANKIEYEIEAMDNEVIVFSEIFYDKGWKSFVDGIEVPHFRANYILRGINVRSGFHEIVFKYDLPIYSYASLISLLSSIIILCLFILLLFYKILGKDFPTI